MNEICGLHLPERMEIYIENLSILEKKMDMNIRPSNYRSWLRHCKYLFFSSALPHVVDRMWPVGTLRATKVTSITNKP